MISQLVIQGKKQRASFPEIAAASFALVIGWCVKINVHVALYKQKPVPKSFLRELKSMVFSCFSFIKNNEYLVVVVVLVLLVLACLNLVVV